MSTQRLILRSEWGATEQDGFRSRPLPITEWWLHHSVTIAPDLVAPFTDDDAAIRTLERIGEQRFGGGISYTYPVTPVGRIYQGHSLGRVGAHTKGHNTVGAAFCLVGNYSTEPPTIAQRTAIAQRMVLDHRAGRATVHHLRGGHRDVAQTACPGTAAYRAIGSINAEARSLWDAGYGIPKPGPRVRPRILEDGFAGPSTRRALQITWGVTPDGIWGPATRKAAQRWAGVTPDGHWGPISRKAIQRKAGAQIISGVWDWDQTERRDPTTLWLQRYYNRHTATK